MCCYVSEVGLEVGGERYGSFGDLLSWALAVRDVDGVLLCIFLRWFLGWVGRGV